MSLTIVRVNLVTDQAWRRNFDKISFYRVNRVDHLCNSHRMFNDEGSQFAPCGYIMNMEGSSRGKRFHKPYK